MKCKTCLFHASMPGIKGIYCGYLFYTGEMRNCDAEDCARYRRMNKAERAKLEKYGELMRNGHCSRQ